MKNLIFFTFSFFVIFNISAKEILLTKTEFGDASIAGEEYWIFDDKKEGNPYSRHDVIWSFDESPKRVRKCAIGQTLLDLVGDESHFRGGIKPYTNYV